MRLVICDNQRILAEALASALGARGHQVLAVTTSVTDCLSAVSAGGPDVCLLELTLGDQLGGLDVARAIHQWYPDTKVLVLSAVTDPEALSQVKSSGVVGFLNKDLSVDQIAAALDVIAVGGRMPDPGLLRVPNHRTVRPDAGTPLDKLSPREKEIVTRIARGESTRQMSFAMSVTAETVRTYVKNVLAKLGAHSRLQVAALASRDGWPIDQPSAVDVLVPACPPITWSGGSLPRNGSWHGDIDAGWTFGAATDSSAHR